MPAERCSGSGAGWPLPEPVAAHVLRPLHLRLPFWRHIEALVDQPYPFLLDSAAESERLGRFSYLGADPFMTFRATRRAGPPGRPQLARVEVGDRSGGLTTFDQCDPFHVLRAVLDDRRLDPTVYVDRPAPFLGGAVGYLGYEAGYFLECLPDLGCDDLQLPEISFGMYDAVAIHDHRRGATFLSVVGRGASQTAAQHAAEARADLVSELLLARDPDGRSPAASRHDGRHSVIVDHADRPSYAAQVECVREHILAGDAFEVCLTHRMEATCCVDPIDLYGELRRVTPAPFAAYLGLPEAAVVSASPERFLKLDGDRVAESRPIKGTRPRGKTRDEDRRLAFDLAHSPKDQAENNMIVDLVRNDLGRVCEIGSVVVTELRSIEPHPRVFQMVSTVRGVLRDDQDAIDLICACFPGGSMTGAPKIEAMKIIDSLEPVKRGVYSGAIGFLDLTGPIDLNIVIRTFVVEPGRATFGVGGAVTSDSDPEAEYQETLDKGEGLKQALSDVQRKEFDAHADPRQLRFIHAQSRPAYRRN